MFFVLTETFIYILRSMSAKNQTSVVSRDQDQDPDQESSQDGGEMCDCCTKGWGTPNEYGLCRCRCECGANKSDCRYTCEFYKKHQKDVCHFYLILSPTSISPMVIVWLDRGQRLRQVR